MILLLLIQGRITRVLHRHYFGTMRSGPMADITTETLEGPVITQELCRKDLILATMPLKVQYQEVVLAEQAIEPLPKERSNAYFTKWRLTFNTQKSTLNL